VSGFTGGQTELLYSMPSSGPAVTAAASTVMSYPNTTTFPAYSLPAGPNGFFPNTGGVGKSLLIKGGGWFTTSSTAMTQTISIGFDSTAGTLSALKACTGAFTPTASITNGAFEFEVMCTMTALGHTGVMNAVGHLIWGPGNNAATAVTPPQIFMLGAPNAGIALIDTITVPYYVEAFSSWSLTTGAPTVTLTNFMIFGLN
jgi:hypothetical protein